MQVDTQLKPWGNSYGLVIPMSYLNMLGTPTDTPIKMSLNPKRFQIQIEEAKTKPKYTVAELLKGMTKDQVHPETYWGPDVGKEIVEY